MFYSAYQWNAYWSGQFQIARVPGGANNRFDRPIKRRLKRVWFDLPISEVKETEEIPKIEEAKEIIKSVALRQSQDSHLDEQQRLEELERELLLIGIEFEGWYLEILNLMRQQFINEEMARLIKEKVQNQDLDMIFILSALASERII